MKTVTTNRRVKMKQCSSCKNGDVINNDTDGEMHIIRDPDSGKIVIRGYLCDDHLQMYDDDGYFVGGV